MFMDNEEIASTPMPPPPPPPPVRARKTAEEIIGIPYARKCKDCGADVKRACMRMFGKHWAGKSDGGRGCMQPVDDICEKWRDGGEFGK